MALRLIQTLKILTNKAKVPSDAPRDWLAKYAV